MDFSRTPDGVLSRRFVHLECAGPPITTTTATVVLPRPHLRSLYSKTPRRDSCSRSLSSRQPPLLTWCLSSSATFPTSPQQAPDEVSCHDDSKREHNNKSMPGQIPSRHNPFKFVDQRTPIDSTAIAHGRVSHSTSQVRHHQRHTRLRPSFHPAPPQRIRRGADKDKAVIRALVNSVGSENPPAPAYPSKACQPKVQHTHTFCVKFKRISMCIPLRPNSARRRWININGTKAVGWLWDEIAGACETADPAQ